MAIKKEVQKVPEFKDFDLTAFRAQKLAIEQAASAEVATRVEAITKLLSEIKQISEDVGIAVSLGDIHNAFEEIDDGWYNSNC
jgi:hypothetical protein